MNALQRRHGVGDRRRRASDRALILVLALALLVVAGGLAPALAEPLDAETVRAAVETWVHAVTADPRPEARAVRVDAVRFQGEILAHVVHLSGGGFCLAGADDGVLPVYYYNPRDTYDAAIPDLRYILEEIAGRTRALRKIRREGGKSLAEIEDVLARRHDLWRSLAAGETPAEEDYAGPPGEPQEMSLHVTSLWHQKDPYNGDCPLGAGGARTVVGCVATATAQLMRFWEWPAHGVGTHGYWWDGDDSCDGTSTAGGQQYADFRDAYDWAHMPDSCKAGCSQQERDALAELSHEVGVALEMDYGVCGSGPSNYDIPGILRTYFEYDDDVRYVDRDEAAMVREIQWLRPMTMDGWNDDGHGHEWLVYGYRRLPGGGATQFHMNMGWENFSPGWYTCDNVPGGFNNNQHIVIEAAPESVFRYVGSSRKGDGSPDDPYEDIEDALDDAPDGTTLVFRAGTENLFSRETLVIDRPLTLEGKDTVIRRDH